NVMWEENGRSLQRIAFFRQQNGRLVQTPTDPNYWGNIRTSKHVWGDLVYHEVDEPFAGSIAANVSRWVDAACTAQCVAGQVPFTLKLITDFSHTAAPHTIHFPSPYLLALNENGQPDQLTQQRLQQAITDYLTPATIRFALPPYEVPGVHLLDYEQAAVAFMAANPHITVELVTLPSLPENLADLAQFDGAAVSPTAAMIAAGLVADLTDYAHSDPAFYPTDFYETVWQA
ncbi:MAG: hypothetical protein KC421_13845, partial [Anaerolineales bacterium]|nr:hypothetical protein [Anaerolineales bacterium]